MRHPVLIIYDIFNDHRRDHLRVLLAPLADKLQQSAWLIPAHCQVDPARLADGLSAAISPADRLRIYAPCADCVIQARWLPANQPHRLHARTTWIAE
jgi:CRISPR-associated endonuclease Cas2